MEGGIVVVMARATQGGRRRRAPPPPRTIATKGTVAEEGARLNDVGKEVQLGDLSRAFLFGEGSFDDLWDFMMKEETTTSSGPDVQDIEVDKTLAVTLLAAGGPLATATLLDQGCGGADGELGTTLALPSTETGARSVERPTIPLQVQGTCLPVQAQGTCLQLHVQGTCTPLQSQETCRMDREFGGTLASTPVAAHQVPAIPLLHAVGVCTERDGIGKDHGRFQEAAVQAAPPPRTHEGCRAEGRVAKLWRCPRRRCRDGAPPIRCTFEERAGQKWSSAGPRRRLPRLAQPVLRGGTHRNLRRPGSPNQCCEGARIATCGPVALLSGAQTLDASR